MKGRGAALVLLPLLAAAVWLHFDYGRDRLGANRLVAMVEGFIVQAGGSGAKVPPPMLEQQLKLMRRAAELDPGEVGVPLTRGGLFFLLERPSAAARAYQDALKLEVRGEIYANLARVHLATGDREAAMRAIHMAVALDHNQNRHFRKALAAERRRRAWQRQVSAGKTGRASLIFRDSFESGDLSHWSGPDDAEEDRDGR